MYSMRRHKWRKYETKKKPNSSDQNTIIIIVMGKKQLSGAQKRKKSKEKEELALEMERLKLGPTKLWTGLVLHLSLIHI